MLEHTHTSRTVRALRALLALAVASVILAPVTTRAATIHQVELVGGGKNPPNYQLTGGSNYLSRHRRTGAFDVWPRAIVAADGDIIRITNWSTAKSATYSPAHAAAPTLYPASPSNGEFTVDDPHYLEFAWTAPSSGTTVVSFGNGGSDPHHGDGSQPNACGSDNVCGTLRITNIAPASPPAAPVLQTPVNNETVSGNMIPLTGKAVNAKDFRIEFRGDRAVMAPYDAEVFGGVDQDANWYTPTIATNSLDPVVLPNGRYKVTVVGRHHQGFEARTTPIFITVDGTDVVRPILAVGAVQMFQNGYNASFSYTTGPAHFSGVVRDDIRANITAVVERTGPFYLPNNASAPWYMPPRTIALRCTQGYPENSSEIVPCASESSPQWLKFQGTFHNPMWPGDYRVTFTVSDGVHAPASVTRTFTLYH